jgi:hypothetical protein
MDGHVRMRRSAAILGAVLVAIGVGLLGYQVGVSRGIAVSGQLAAGPGGAVPYGWYGPHVFFGFGPFIPFFFLLFWFVVLRGLFWGGPGRWRSHRGYWDDPADRFDAWHRRAHERMTTDPPAPDRR